METKAPNLTHWLISHRLAVDFRAPENFLFVPLWMLRSLRAKPYDVVFMTWVKLNDGVTIELQPHQDAFLQLANPRSVLENELKYYSSATRGSTISLLYEGKQYATDCVGRDGTRCVPQPTRLRRPRRTAAPQQKVAADGGR